MIAQTNSTPTGNAVYLPTLNNHQAAAYIGHSPSWLAKSRMTGDGPPFVKTASRVVYRRQDLDEWLIAHLKRSTNETVGAQTVAA
jgi:hypothetical protein